MTRLAIALAALLLSAAAHSAAVEIHPVPRAIETGSRAVPFDRSASVVPAAPDGDAPSLALLRQTISRAPAGAARLVLRVGSRGQSGIDAHLAGVPAVSGAYRLKVAPDGIVIAGHDARGIYYGCRTFAALAATSGGLAESIVTDWPEVPFRGVVEGFYGTPWSHARRLSLIRFMGEVKLDTYIYGPKDDPFHSSPDWRRPYPDAEAARIRELVAACRESHVDFVWAIHPGKDIRWTDEDFGHVLAKFEAMHKLGVRAFSVFFDDISGEGTKPDQQALLLNFLTERFVRTKGDVLPLVMCPTQYNRAWSGGDYLDVLGSDLDPSIHVMWTGDRVVADLNRPAMEWINSRIRRKAYIWWNFPVSDYVRNHLLLGPAYGNAPDIGPLYGGFVSNPMERSEASKVALFGIADYTWNPAAYDAGRAWLAGIRHVIPNAAEAYRTFASHNSDLGPNGHGYRREESVSFKSAADAFLAGIRDGKAPDSAALRSEFERIAGAPETIRSRADNPLLIEEIAPWLDAFEQLGQAGTAGLEALQAIDAANPEASWRALTTAHDALDRIDEIDRKNNRNPYQPGIRTGSLVVTPLVRELVDHAGSRLIAALGGRPPLRAKPDASATTADGLERMTDGREDTHAYFREIQRAGDWFGVDLGGNHELRRVRILQGRHDGDHDRIHDGVLEGLGPDGKWREIRRVTDARTDVVLDPPATFRKVRLRVVKPGVPGGKPDLWTAVREFEINPSDAAELRSNLPAFQHLPVRLNDGQISVSPAFEVHALPPGGFLGLKLPAPLEIGAVEVDFGVANPLDHLVIEGNAAGNDWQKLDASAEGSRLLAKPARTLRAVRVRNHGKAPLEVTLKAFTIATPPEAAAPYAAAADGSTRSFVSLAADFIELETKPSANRIALLFSGETAGLKITPRGPGGDLPPLTLRAEQSLVVIPLPEGTRRLSIQSTSPARLHECIPIP
jgi:hyaluronoglucosaminidase